MTDRSVVPPSFRVPSVILIGVGARHSVPEVCARIGLRAPILVTDGALLGSGPIGEFVADLVKRGLVVGVYEGVRTEPTTEHVEQILNLLHESSADGIIAVGGGSPIDAAKGAAALATNGGTVASYEGVDRLTSSSLPVVAVPTTAGTGSEVTRVTVILDPDRRVKMLIMADQLLPAAAIVDAALTISCPPAVTSAAGVDALSHAIEAFVSRRHQPLTDALALSACGLIARSLRRAHARGDDLAARSDVMEGQLQAGLAFSNASVALVHGMSRPLGAVFGIPHGIANAMLLPSVMRFSLPSAMDRYAQLAGPLGGVGSSVDERATASVQAVERLVSDLGIPTLGGYGVDRAALDATVDKMAADAIASGSPANNPRIPSWAEIAALYRASF